MYSLSEDVFIESSRYVCKYYRLNLFNANYFNNSAEWILKLIKQ